MFFRANAYCKTCNKGKGRATGCHYSIIIAGNPFSDEDEEECAEEPSKTPPKVLGMTVEVEFEKSEPHAHEVSIVTKKTRAPQYREKEKRYAIARDIILNHNKSGARYRYALMSRSVKVAKATVYRRIVHEYIQRKLSENGASGHGWYEALLNTYSSMRATIPATVLPGYLQTLLIIPQLQIHLYMQIQLECIKSVEPDRRILHIDATGSLVNLTKRNLKETSVSYNRTLNYFLVLKDLKDLEVNRVRSAMVGELVSSRHDVFGQSSFLGALKFDFEKLFKDKLVARLVITDYSWAAIHSILETSKPRRCHSLRQSCPQLGLR